MTDISELVKRMRGLAEYVDDCDEAADALEAQAKEIRIYQQTELTYITRVADVQREYSEMQAKLKARIAELKAVLKPFEEKFSKSLADAEKLAATEGYELPDDQPAEDIYAWALSLTWGDLRAARAALKGEKG